jgi:2-methylcitrate dehydratase PrpD
MNEIERLAQFAAELAFEQLPQPVIDRAIAVVRDTVGVILGGSRDTDVRRLAEWVGAQHPGASSLFGFADRAAPEWATLVHATAATTIEMDEGHAFARGHAAIHAVPTALALGEARNHSGPEVLTALVAGYEVAARVGVATDLRRPVHPFGAWGVLGAAAVGARLRGFDSTAMTGVLHLAAAYAINPSFAAALEGANSRNTYAGLVNQLGLLAVDLYELGFQGAAGGVCTTFGEILGERFRRAALVEDLGDRYEILRGYFKPYSACRYTHAAVDAALALRAQRAIDAGEIERIEVETYDFAARLNGAQPQTTLAGRFSIPFVVASTLVTGGAGPEIFQPERLTDPALLSLAARVSVVEDPALTAMTPARRPARLRIFLTGGDTGEILVTQSKGDPDLPMSAGELRAKFDSLATPAVGAVRAARLWELLGDLPHLSDWTDLADLTQPPTAS